MDRDAKEMRAMRWRASRRGMLEVSMILDSYIEARRETMATAERASMERLLELPDADLWDILVAERADSAPDDVRLVEDLRAHANNLHARIGQ